MITMSLYRRKKKTRTEQLHTYNNTNYVGSISLNFNLLCQPSTLPCIYNRMHTCAFECFYVARGFTKYNLTRTHTNIHTLMHNTAHSACNLNLHNLLTPTTHTKKSTHFTRTWTHTNTSKQWQLLAQPPTPANT